MRKSGNSKCLITRKTTLFSVPQLGYLGYRVLVRLESFLRRSRAAECPHDRPRRKQNQEAPRFSSHLRLALVGLSDLKNEDNEKHNQDRVGRVT